MSNYEMFTDAGNEAVMTWVINPTIEVIDSGPTDDNPSINIRKRAAAQIEHGMEHVAAIGHREVNDTAVKEIIYHDIGVALRRRGILSEHDDLFNWDL